MCLFLLHFVRLIFQVFDLGTPGSNVLLQFFDLVIEHKFELFQLLRLFFEFVDAFVLVADGVLSVGQVQLLGFLVRFQLVKGNNHLV